MANIQEKKEEENQDYGEIFFGWKFSEFPHYQRERKWYVWGAIIVIILLIYSFLTINFLFGLITIMAALIILLFQRNNNEVEFKITEDGILINKKLFAYKNLKNFYIIYNPPEVKTLYFEPKSILNPRIPIALEKQNPVAIREVLRQYLEEDLEREDEPVSEQISRIFKL